MGEDTELIKELGIENFTPEQQHNVIDEFHMQVGETLAEKLTTAQLEEYQHIIDGNDVVIAAWLAANEPDYRDTEAYQELERDMSEGAEQVPADKVYAYLAWVEKNSPDLEVTVERLKAEIKADADLYK